MNGMLTSVIAFIVAIGVLVTVHEFGHFWVARRLGVKVLRFSVGFGRPLWKTRFGKDETELVVAAIPLGGYVKMLDEHEGDVPEADRHRAFNRQPIGSRIAVVAAGPVFNFLFAVLAYWAMYVAGVTGLRPVIGEVLPSSYAAQAGFSAGDEILSIEGKSTPTWETAALALLDAGLDGNRTIPARVRGAQGGESELWIRFDDAAGLLKKGNVLSNFGLAPWHPLYPAIIDRLVKGGPGEQAGLHGGDEIIAADGQAIADWSAWVDYVRQRPGQTIAVQVDREGTLVELEITPGVTQEDGEAIGRIGAYVRLPDDERHATMRVVVRYGLVEAIPVAAGKTLDMATLTLRTLWKMVSGKASVENLSGPISIAKYAGQSAAIGFAAFLGFLAIISVSLGVLNLLPIPILDGGHLLYYLIELFKGSPLSETAQLLGQRIGIFLLLVLMTLAFYNDLVRLFE